MQTESAKRPEMPSRLAFPFAVTPDDDLGFQWVGDVTNDLAVPVTSRFHAAISIAGVLHHLTGIEVRCNDQGEQVAAYDAHEEELIQLYLLAGPDEPFQSIDVDGRPYVCFVVPST